MKCKDCKFISVGVKRFDLNRLGVRWCRKCQKYISMEGFESCSKFEAKEGQDGN